MKIRMYDVEDERTIFECRSFEYIFEYLNNTYVDMNSVFIQYYDAKRKQWLNY